MNKTFIITMAGLGSRFLKEGYSCPKYEIMTSKNKSLFYLSIRSLENLIEKDDEIIFIARKENEPEKFIIKEMNNNFSKLFEKGKVKIKSIDYVTDGQATTAYLAKDLLKLSKSEDKPVIIYNIDTYVEPKALRIEDIKGDGWIPCFNGKGDHWSFCKTVENINEDNLDDLDRVIEVTEKKRISPNCSIGLYYFSSFRLYEDLYKQYESNGMEKYIMPMYKILLDQNKNVYITSVSEDKVHCLGTPQELREYEEYLKENEL